MKTKPVKPSPQSAPSPAMADTPGKCFDSDCPDSKRLDKLERIEKYVRLTKYFVVKGGRIRTTRTKKDTEGEPCWNSLRLAIDAAPEPPEAA